MSLIDHPARPLSDRSVAAMAAIMERLRRAEAEARSTRLRLAHEIGFDARHPSEVRPGDVIRVPYNHWQEVISVTRVVPEATDCGPFWRFDFGNGEGTYEVDDWSDDNPIAPRSVLVAVDDDETVF